MTKSLSPSKNTYSPQTQKQIENILVAAGQFKNDVEGILRPYQKAPFTISSTATTIDLLFSRFHAVAKQLQKRQRQRQFEVIDEYDVQDVLHSLLKIYFADIRAEEYCPSYAGTCARLDFFLRVEGLAIEAKMAGRKHNAQKIREELILDKAYYSKRHDIKTLYCLVYDPNEIIPIAPGFEYDLGEKTARYEVKVYIVPKR